MWQYKNLTYSLTNISCGKLDMWCFPNQELELIFWDDVACNVKTLYRVEKAADVCVTMFIITFEKSFHADLC